ncbi:hypothetical protein D3C76_1214780 [compost metagenome]
MGDAEVDQARFLAAGDDFHRVAKDGFGAADEVGAVARLAQGVGAHHPYRARRHAADELGEALQAVEAALHGFLAEQAFLADAGGQLDFLAKPLKDADLAVVGLGQDHVETVGAEVEGGDQREGLRRGMGHVEKSGKITATSCHDRRYAPNYSPISDWLQPGRR